MNKFFIKDSSGKKSITATAFFIGMLIANAKLLLSGVIVGKVSLGTMAGADYALIMGSLGTIYSLRRSKAIKEDA